MKILDDSLVKMGVRLAEHAMTSASHNQEIKWVNNWLDKNLLLNDIDRNTLVNAATETITKARGNPDE